MLKALQAAVLAAALLAAAIFIASQRIACKGTSYLLQAMPCEAMKKGTAKKVVWSDCKRLQAIASDCKRLKATVDD